MIRDELLTYSDKIPKQNAVRILINKMSICQCIYGVMNGK